uniref:Forkhead associated domain protein n=1 Tax=uncultured bacterium CSL132 TaxID=1091568 RepID=G4WVK5_9BACT|nr:forkhead associated domain protein [uncultured bacterium CSL132]
MDMSNKTSSEQFLAHIDRLIEWKPLASLMHAISTRVRADVPLPAVKMLLLARWYGMSETSLIDAFQDRISFRRFLGLPLNDFRDDVRLAEAFRRNVAQAPIETQALIHSIEMQLLSMGFTIKTGIWAEAVVEQMVPSAAPANIDISSATVFHPSEIAKLREQVGSVVARGGEKVAGYLAPMTGSATLQPPAECESALVHGVIEWPWGATTELKQRLNIGRDFGFCPFARQLQSYPYVSRKHAELVACADGIWARDLHSHNGTFVDDQEVPKGQAFLVDSDASLRCGPNLVILLKLKYCNPASVSQTPNLSRV